MTDILLNVSITGGIVILLWYLSYPFSKKHFKASWHYAVLKITMVFMVIPISIFAPAFNNVFSGLFAKPDLPYIAELSGQIQIIKIDTESINSVNSALSDIVFYDDNQNQTIIDDTPSSTEQGSVNIPYLQIIWLVTAVFLCANGISKMRKFKKQIIKCSSGDVDRETLELFSQCKTQLKIHGEITLRISEHIKTPLVFGLTKPCIIFPETDMSTDEKRIALIHELTHIKHGDLWIKIFACIISAIHWFNPLTHLLRRKISVISEEYCDECVVKTMTKEERFLYGNLILKVACDISVPQSKFCSTLSAPTKNIKRRLLNMMNTKKSHRGMVALSVIFALIMCSFATIYAFAANTNTPDNGIMPYGKVPEILSDITTVNSEPETPDLENWTYGEVEVWIENRKEELEVYWNLGKLTQEEIDEIKKMYESWLVCVPRVLVINGDGSTKWVATTDELGLTYWDYEEYKTWIENKKTELQNSLDKNSSYVDEVTGMTQEKIDWIINFHEAQLEVIKDGVVKISKTGYYINPDEMLLYTYTLRHTLPNGEEISAGFSATSYDELYNLIKSYLDKQVDESNMTQEEADNKLTEMQF
jgi:Antirepressor regulating drug resistance, predicted signal transduction N-terminal membrane component